MEVDLTRFGLVIAPAQGHPLTHPEALREANGSMRLTPEVAEALGCNLAIPGVHRITLLFNVIFTEGRPRDSPNGKLQAWDMGFQGTGKVGCDISLVEPEKLEERDG